ncbi:MAG: class I SAM-dependent methyltransferase [Gemmatimonadota bacterium]|jgi:SAM-dependent methyltransferase
MDLQGHSLAELRDLTETALAVAAAHESGIFTALGEAAADAGALARRLELDPRATDIVCQALVEMGLLERTDGAYRPTEACRRELCDPDAPDYVAAGLSHWLSSMEKWVRLADVIRDGGPAEKRPSRRDPSRAKRFMSAMAAAPDERIRRIVDLCLERRPDARTVLDVGGGPGHITRAFVGRGLEGTLLDTEDIVDYVVDAYGLEDVDGLEVVVGDFNEALPNGPFDVVLFSNVLHIYSPERNLEALRRAARVLTPGGVVAVAEFLRGRSPRAARFGIQMLLHTDQGNAYGEDQVKRWLDEAGFAGVQVADLDENRQLVTALKA